MKNKIKTTIWLTSFLAINLLGCMNNDSTENIYSNKTTEISKKKTDTEEVEKTNAELLEGKWVNKEDKTNFLIFEKNIRKEMAEGMDTWDEEEFVLSDKCETQPELTNRTENKKDRYISCKNSDLCWYIVSINNETLTLNFLGRGNTLSYFRVIE
jgi:hypothetical protein